MDVTCGEEVLNVEHPLNRISPEVPLVNVAEQVNEIPHTAVIDLVIIDGEEEYPNDKKGETTKKEPTTETETTIEVGTDGSQNIISNCNRNRGNNSDRNNYGNNTGGTSNGDRKDRSRRQNRRNEAN